MRIDSKGFNLIELVIVIVSLSIIALAVGYRVISTTDKGGVVAVDQVVADIQYVQQLAMATCSQKTVSFVASSNTYTVAGETRELPKGVMAGNTITYTFNSLGEPVAGGDQVLSIDSRQIKVIPVTGKVVIL